MPALRACKPIQPNTRQSSALQDRPRDGPRPRLDSRFPTLAGRARAFGAFGRTRSRSRDRDAKTPCCSTADVHWVRPRLRSGTRDTSRSTRSSRLSSSAVVPSLHARFSAIRTRPVHPSIPPPAPSQAADARCTGTAVPPPVWMDLPIPRPHDDPCMHGVPVAARTQRRKLERLSTAPSPPPAAPPPAAAACPPTASPGRPSAGPPHDGQKPRPLQVKGTKRWGAQSPHRSHAKPATPDIGHSAGSPPLLGSRSAEGLGLRARQPLGARRVRRAGGHAASRRGCCSVADQRCRDPSLTILQLKRRVNQPAPCRPSA